MENNEENVSLLSCQCPISSQQDDGAVCEFCSSSGMLQPASLLRHESATFSASVHLRPRDVACGCCGFRPRCLQPLAAPGLFAALLALAAAAHTALQAHLAHHYPQAGRLSWSIWLVLACAAPLIAPREKTSRRPQLLACFILVEALVATGAVCLAFFMPADAVESSLCNSPSAKLPVWLLAVVLLLQVFSIPSAVSMKTFGLPYLDDTVDNTVSPSLIGIVLGASHLGPSLLIFMTYFNLHPMTGSLVACCALTISSLCIISFPPRPRHAEVQRAAASILREARGERVTISSEVRVMEAPIDSRMWVTIRRLLKNKMVMCKTFSVALLYAAVEGFTLAKHNYLLPFYSFGKSSDWWNHQMIGLGVPCAGFFGAIIAGVLTSAFRPRARTLAIFTLISVIGVAVMFFVQLPTACLPRTLNFNSACSDNCDCQLHSRSPLLCNDLQKSFPSACLAGCTGVQRQSNGMLVAYTNCTCLDSSHNTLTVGGCSNTECSSVYTSANLLSSSNECPGHDCTRKLIALSMLLVIKAAVVGATGVMGLMICLRCVLREDKGLMFAVHMSVMGLGISLLGKLAFKAIGGTFCLSPNSLYSCLRSASIFAGCLCLAATMLEIIVVKLARNIHLFGDADIEQVTMEDFDKPRSKSNLKRRATPYARRKKPDGVGMRRLGPPDGASESGNSSSDEAASKQLLNSDL